MFRTSIPALRQRFVDHRTAIAITLAVTAFSFILHLKWCVCAMNYNDARFDRLIDLHLNGYPYLLRPMTTYTVLFLSKLGITIKQAFFLLQYTLVLLLSFSFYRYLLSMGFAKSRAILGLFLLLISYPILAAHMAPVHTWDDLWAHLFTLLAFTSAVGSRPTTSIIWFTMACFAREQSFILLPALVFAVRLFNPNRPLSFLIALTAAPIVIYGIYFALRGQSPRMDRFGLVTKNFEMPLRTSDTLFSLFVSFGFAWVTTLIGLVNRNRSALYRYLYWGIILSLPATVLFTLFLTNARETRILFPPFLFVVPMCLIVLDGIYRNLRSKIKPPDVVWGLFIFAVLMAAGIVLGPIVFPRFEYRHCPEFHHIWVGIQFGLVLNLLAYTLRWGWKGLVLDGVTIPAAAQRLENDP